MVTEEELSLQAKDFAKKNREAIARDLTDLEKYPSSRTPISVFMAGSPGAGKTEFSKSLLKILERSVDGKVIRIDADELRSRLPGYNGSNSSVFNGAVSLMVEKIHDYVLRRSQHFVLDGTLANHVKAKDNIARSLKKHRAVFIFYIYQNPKVAWDFTQARELIEGRKITREAFIERFIAANKSIRKLREEFGNEVVVMLVRKNFEKNTIESLSEIKPGESIDDHIKQSYTKEDLEKMI